MFPPLSKAQSTYPQPYDEAFRTWVLRVHVWSVFPSTRGLRLTQITERVHATPALGLLSLHFSKSLSPKDMSMFRASRILCWSLAKFRVYAQFTVIGQVYRISVGFVRGLPLNLHVKQPRSQMLKMVNTTQGAATANMSPWKLAGLLPGGATLPSQRLALGV